MKLSLVFSAALLFLSAPAFAYNYTAVPCSLFGYDQGVYTNFVCETKYKSPSYDFTDLYLVGWTRDSKIAYVTFNNNDGADFHLYVQDLKTDRIVWKLDEDREGAHQVESEVGYLPWEFEDLWYPSVQEFQPKLSALGVVPPVFQLIEPFPLKVSRGFRGTLDCRIVEEHYSGEDYFREFIRYRVEMTGPDGGTKTVYRATNAYIVGVEAVGCLRSPYEDRVAVVLFERRQRREDYIEEVKPVIAGCAIYTGYDMR